MGECSPPLPSRSGAAWEAAEEGCAAGMAFEPRRAGVCGVARRCSSGVEQLTCNQQVVGSTPTIGSARRQVVAHGEVPEWPKGADCKSAGERLRRFESSPLHFTVATVAAMTRRGSSSGGRARAFQARGRGFDSRLPLQLRYAHVAQVAEHFLGKEEVTGSNPVVGFASEASVCGI